jgi:hypothetical protein
VRGSKTLLQGLSSGRHFSVLGFVGMPAATSSEEKRKEAPSVNAFAVGASQWARSSPLRSGRMSILRKGREVGRAGMGGARVKNCYLFDNFRLVIPCQ